MSQNRSSAAVVIGALRVKRDHIQSESGVQERMSCPNKPKMVNAKRWVAMIWTTRVDQVIRAPEQCSESYVLVRKICQHANSLFYPFLKK